MDREEEECSKGKWADKILILVIVIVGTISCDGMSPGGTTRCTRRRSDQTSADSVELSKPKKSKVVAPIEEPKFNCPICMCPITEEVSTKCGHNFCKEYIKNAISLQAKCPTCRKKSLLRTLSGYSFQPPDE